MDLNKSKSNYEIVFAFLNFVGQNFDVADGQRISVGVKTGK
jgi:hypothetical protein